MAWVPEIEAFVVSRYDDIAEVNRRPGEFSSSVAMGPKPIALLLQEHFNAKRRKEGRPERPVVDPPPVLLTADPPVHTRQRALLSRAFGPRRVGVLEQRIEVITSELIDRFADKERCEFVSELAVPLPLTILAEVLGVDEGDLGTFKRWSDDFAGLFGAAPPDEARLESLATTSFEFDAYFRARIAERRESPRDDLLSDVVHAAAEGEAPLTSDEIVTMFAQVLVAGNETTTKMLTFAMSFLAERSELADSLRENPDLVPGFIEEVLRLESPIQGFWRRATRDTEVGGVAIPAGSLVLVLYGSGNRDESCFEDPDELRPERRADHPNLAFGLGAHFCLGARLARAEGRIVTEAMLSTFDHIAFAPEHEVRVDPSFLLHGMQTLHLALQPRG